MQIVKHPYAILTMLIAFRLGGHLKNSLCVIDHGTIVCFLELELVFEKVHQENESLFLKLDLEYFINYVFYFQGLLSELAKLFADKKETFVLRTWTVLVTILGEVSMQYFSTLLY